MLKESLLHHNNGTTIFIQGKSQIKQTQIFSVILSNYLIESLQAVKSIQRLYFYNLLKGIEPVSHTDDKNKKGGKNPVK